MRAGWALLLVLVACDDAVRRPGGSGGSTCTPGRSVACTCTGGADGVQTCLSDRSYGPCECNGGHPDATVTDSGGAQWDSSGGPPDLGIDHDAGFPDLGFRFDAGFPDFGVRADAEVPDLGFRLDAGFPDLGFRLDAGFPDLGLWPDASTPDSGLPADGGIAGACSADSQCPSGRCHPVYGQCIPTNRKLACESCQSDSECGLPDDLCLTIQDGPTLLERVCGQRCRTRTDCPRGYSCRPDQQCYPVAGSVRPHTCHAYRDTLAHEVCDSTNGMDTCGIESYADGTCVPVFNQCSVGCNTNDDCPAPTTCTNLVVSSFCL